MNKHVIIVLVSCLVITISLAYTLFGVIAADNLQLQWYQEGQFNLTLLINGGQIIMCNPSFVPVNLEKFDIHITHQDTTSILEIPRIYIEANKDKAVYGTMKDSTAIRAALSSAPNIAFLGSAMDSTLGHLDILTQADTRLFGIIPITMTNQYTVQEFIDELNDADNC